MLPDERPDVRLVDPRHDHADHDSEDHAAEDERDHGERGEEASAQVLPLLDRRGEKERIGIELEVAMDRIRDIRRGRDDAEDQRQHERELHDHERRVAIDVAQRAADLYRVARHCAEREEEKEDEENVEERSAEVKPEIEFEDVPGHDVRPPSPRTSCCAMSRNKRLPATSAPARTTDRAACRDRKSTRLNSSHGSISYSL